MTGVRSDALSTPAQPGPVQDVLTSPEAVPANTSASPAGAGMAVVESARPSGADASGRPGLGGHVLSLHAATIAASGMVHRYADHPTRRDIAGERAVLARTAAMLRGRAAPAPLAQATRLLLLGDGSSLNAAATAHRWIEQLAHLPCDVESSGTWLRHGGPVAPGSAGVLVCGCGETDETLQALAVLRARGLPVVALTGATDSTLARAADMAWSAALRPEQGGTATGSFTASLMALLYLGLAIGLARGKIDEVTRGGVEWQLADAAIACALTEAAEARCAAIAWRIARAGKARFGGRQWCASIAAEGALKQRDLCTIPAEAHAVAALRDLPEQQGVPVVMCAAADAQVAQAVADARAVRARGGHVVVLTDAGSAASFHDAADETLALPGRGMAQAFAQAVALQLIAFHAAMADRHGVELVA